MVRSTRVVATEWSPAELEELRRKLEVAVRRCCPPSLAAQADDLVQTAMLKVTRLLSDGQDTRASSPAYLYRAAHSALVDEIRRQRRRREVPLDDDERACEVPTDGPATDRLVRSGEIRNAIHECLGSLIEDRRRAVTLSLLGHSVGEVARLLGWPGKRADNMVYRGLADLRRCLRGKGIEP
jgi:RNA polymerase sigma-70 factor (ECF subfamily)